MSIVPEPPSSQRDAQGSEAVQAPNSADEQAHAPGLLRGDRFAAAQNADGSAWWFFLLVLGLVSPLLVLDEVFPYQLLPGVPLAGFGVVCPTLAAVILVARRRSAAGVKALLARTLDVRGITELRWAAAIALIMPGVTAVALCILRQTATEMPAFEVSAPRLAGLAVAFFIGGMFEELGWTAYAIEALQSRRSALTASLLVGGACAVFHYVALWQVGRSFEWIAWWTLYILAGRVILVWLFNSTGGSVFAAALFHAMTNVTWQLYPVHGSSFDPRITGSVLAGVALIVVAGAGPELHGWGSGDRGHGRGGPGAGSARPAERDARRGATEAAGKPGRS